MLVPTASLPIQLLPHSMEKLLELNPTDWGPCDLYGRSKRSSRFLATVWPSPGHCSWTKLNIRSMIFVSPFLQNSTYKIYAYFEQKMQTVSPLGFVNVQDRKVMKRDKHPDLFEPLLLLPVRGLCIS